MKRPVLISLLPLLLIALAFSQTKKPLTNDDVMQMVNAGFDESTIIKAVQANEPSFDTSVSGLMALKAAGVPKPIIDAILEAQARKLQLSTRPSPVAAPDPAAAYPKNPGVYYQSGQSWVQLEKVVPESTKLDKPFMGIGTYRFIARYRDTEAPTQLAVQRPVFCLVLPSAPIQEFSIVQFEKKGKYRQSQYLSSTVGGTMTTQKYVTRVDVARVANDLFTVTPSSDLAPGEYLLTSAANVGGYAFGIRTAK